MSEPLFWLGLSLFSVAISLTAVLVAAIPALQELARAARSAEKLFDTLHREFPPTLEAIRLTGLEISELTNDINDGVRSVSEVVQTVDRSISNVSQQANKAQTGTRGFVAGVKAAWKTWKNPSASYYYLDNSKGTSAQKNDSSITDVSIPPNQKFSDF